ncbi:MAG: dipeptidase [Clostridiales bacterium]|nr:dipeptidase [Clostridiales bacterium]
MASLHEESFVFDAHCDTVLDWVEGRRRLTPRSTQGHIDLPRLKEGGVDVQIFALFVAPEYHHERSLPRLLQLLDAFYRELEAHRDEMILCLTGDDLLRAKREGKVGALLSIEGAEPVGRDLARLRIFYRLGVRAMGLVWNGRNDVADGVGEARTGGGLTRFGVDVVGEMERLGMMVDVSHLSERGFWDVVAVATKPFIASHSNARALCDHPRNLDDRQIKALAEKGGVMGLNFYPGFLTPSGEATLDDVLNHAEHIIQLVGPQHLGLGSDFDGISTTPKGLEDVSFLPRFTEGLLARGYSEDVVKMVLGENFLRVFREVLG